MLCLWDQLTCAQTWAFIYSYDHTHTHTHTPKVLQPRRVNCSNSWLHHLLCSLYLCVLPVKWPTTEQIQAQLMKHLRFSGLYCLFQGERFENSCVRLFVEALGDFDEPQRSTMTMFGVLTIAVRIYQDRWGYGIYSGPIGSAVFIITVKWVSVLTVAGYCLW